MPKEVTASVSSLIDLKAELFRKQTLKKAQEASAGAVDTKRLFVKGSGKSHPLSISKDEVQRKNELSAGRRDRIEQLQAQIRQQEAQERKVKEALNRKAEIYERMSSGDRVTYDDGREIEFMVDFGKKSNDADDERQSSTDKTTKYIEEETIEFTDTFGRQRRCAPKELANMISRRDASLIKHDDRLLTIDNDDRIKQRVTIDDDDMASSSQIGPIHHVNVASDEPREYGVAHFKFDADETKRMEQMQELNVSRQKTIENRTKSQLMKEKRDRLNAERLEKVRKRKGLESDPRLAEILGIQPETDPTAIPLPNESVSIAKDDEPIVKKKPTSIRAWDRGKNTFSQERWVTKCRDERDDEFAPPSSYHK